MKKTACIQLALITAALAGCGRPRYQQSQYGQYDDMSDEPDGSNSCPMAESALPPDYYLWYGGLRPFDYYYGDGFGLEGYYLFRFPARIFRAGFGRHVSHGRHGGHGHS